MLCCILSLGLLSWWNTQFRSISSLHKATWPLQVFWCVKPIHDPSCVIIRLWHHIMRNLSISWCSLHHGSLSSVYCGLNSVFVGHLTNCLWPLDPKTSTLLYSVLGNLLHFSRGQSVCSLAKYKLIVQGRTYKEVQTMIGCSTRIISNALKWQTKPERHGRKQKTTIWVDGRTAKMATTQSMINSGVIQESLKLPVRTGLLDCEAKARYQQEDPTKFHYWKKWYTDWSKFAILLKNALQPACTTFAAFIPN